MYVHVCVCARVRVLRTVYINYTSFTAGPRKYRKVKSPHNRFVDHTSDLSVSGFPKLLRSRFVAAKTRWPRPPTCHSPPSTWGFQWPAPPIHLIFLRLSGDVRVKDHEFWWVFFIGIYEDILGIITSCNQLIPFDFIKDAWENPSNIWALKLGKSCF